MANESGGLSSRRAVTHPKMSDPRRTLHATRGRTAMEHLVRSHVERCLQDIWQVCQLAVDEDGDYPFRAGVASCWVRVDSQVPVLVRVFGHAVLDVRRSAGLLRELNEVNCRARTA